MSNLFAELKRRNIFRVAGVYAVVGWILAQIAALAANSFGAPDWVMKMIIVVLGIGFPVAMLLAWAFEMTPEGVKRSENVEDGDSITDKTGRRLDYTIIVGLVLVAALVVGSRFMPQKMTAPDVTEVSEVVAHSETEEPTEITDEKISIAVLPFEDFSSDKDQDYFAKGISEELLNVLARIDGLRVSSRTSSFAFKERNASTGEIAEALNVKHILEGSIRKSGTTLRITAQLIDTRTDEHMWSETYDRPLTAENIFAIQDEIAAAIVVELKGKLSLEPSTQAPRTNSLEAYELYLRARQEMNKRKPDTLRAAEAGFRQVIALDPEFAPAFSGLADTYMLMTFYTDVGEEEGIRLAKPHVERALQLAPNSAESLTTASMFAIKNYEFEKGAALADRAIAANPNHTDAYLRKHNATIISGNAQAALANIQKALALDPLSAVILTNLSSAQLQAGDREAAKRTMRDNIRWNPESPFGFFNLAELSFEDGDIAGAHSLYRDALALNPQNRMVQSYVANLYFSVGMNDVVSTVSKRPDDLALALLLNGQKQQSQRLVRDTPDNFGLGDMNMGYVLYMAGDVKGAYPNMRQHVTKNDMLDIPIPFDYLNVYADAAYIFKENGDGDAGLLINKLDAYFGNGKTARDYSFNVDLRAGIILQLIKGDEDAAYEWLDRFLDLGFPAEDFFTAPPFGSLRGTPKFAEREVRMKQNAAKHRALIEAQLSNPKPNWINLNE